jgi:hypothetical protein
MSLEEIPSSFQNCNISSSDRRSHGEQRSQTVCFETFAACFDIRSRKHADSTSDMRFLGLCPETNIPRECHAHTLYAPALLQGVASLIGWRGV